VSVINRLRAIRFLPLGLLLAFSSGCAIIPGLHVQVPDEGEGQGFEVVEISAEVIRRERERRTRTGVIGHDLPILQASHPREEYVVGPGDILNIIVWEHPELTTPAGEFRGPEESGRLVDANGTVFYPYVGTFVAAGMTAAEVREFIGERLSRVIRNPQVDVRVVAFRSQRVQVTGEVRTPGLVTLNDTPKGVLEAINERGGLSESASRRQALLLRGDQVYSIDLAGMLTGASPTRNIALQDSDILHIPDANEDQVFLLGEVSDQSSLIMRQRTITLTQALAHAGGLNRNTASDSGVVVFRRSPEADEDALPTIYVLNLSRPENLLLAGEFELMPRDVVYVKATGFAKYNLVISQVLPTITSIFQLDRVITRR
jgi:polysaccharide export outer membrane protein